MWKGQAQIDRRPAVKQHSYGAASGAQTYVRAVSIALHSIGTLLVCYNSPCSRTVALAVSGERQRGIVHKSSRGGVGSDRKGLGSDTSDTSDTSPAMYIIDM